MSLPYDVFRCNGQNLKRTARCKKRDKCRRYLERNNLGQQSPVMFAPDKPEGCENFMEVKSE